jgi:hypothetical protein
MGLGPFECRFILPKCRPDGAWFDAAATHIDFE